MTLTRQQAEQILVGRCRRLMSKVAMDIGITGSNGDIAEPLAQALRAAGYTTANLAQPDDTELALVTTADTDKVLDLAELRLLENIQSNNDLVDREDATVRWSYGQIAGHLQQRISALQKKVEDLYGIGAPTAFSVGMTRIDGYSELVSE